MSTNGETEQSSGKSLEMFLDLNSTLNPVRRRKERDELYTKDEEVRISSDQKLSFLVLVFLFHP